MCSTQKLLPNSLKSCSNAPSMHHYILRTEMPKFLCASIVHNYVYVLMYRDVSMNMLTIIYMHACIGGYI